MKILALPTCLNGCSYIRIVSPLNKINELELAEALYFTENKFAKFTENYNELVESADVILFRGDHYEIVDNIMKTFDCSKKLFIYDSDDNDYIITPDNDAYRWFGLEDVWYNDRKNNKSLPMWIDCESELAKELPPGRLYSKKENTKRCEMRDKILSICDGIFVTTENLANVYRTLNQNVFILPNAVDFKIWRTRKKLNTGKKLRIGWNGGSSHYYDFYKIYNELVSIIKNDKNLTLVMAGAVPTELLSSIPKEQLEVHEWVSAEVHPYRLQCLDIDIALIPLAGRDFDKYKSNNKYLEFSSMGIPSVVSNTSPYKEDIIDGVNGLLFNNGEEMIKKLRVLIDNPLERARMGNSAYELVKRDFNSSNIVLNYIEAIKKIQGGK